MSDKYPIEGMTVMPVGASYMPGAFVGLVRYLMSVPEAVALCAKETGHDISTLQNRTMIDAMIDRESGYEKKVFAGFADWVANTQWGVESDASIKQDFD